MRVCLLVLLQKSPERKRVSETTQSPTSQLKGKRKGGRLGGKDGKQNKAWARPKVNNRIEAVPDRDGELPRLCLCRVVPSLSQT